MSTAPQWLTSAVRTVQDFPTEGINFYDLAPIWESSANMSRCSIALAELFADSKTPVDAVIGIEARGFIFGVPVAQRLGVGFIAARKAGKVPPPFHGVSYDLEYGSDALQISAESLTKDDNVLIVDDVIATGGTVSATIDLVKASGAKVVGVAAVIELEGLGGRDRIDAAGAPVRALWTARA